MSCSDKPHIDTEASLYSKHKEYNNNASLKNELHLHYLLISDRKALSTTLLQLVKFCAQSLNLV